MGGIVGRLFREFAVTLSAAILISLVVSLTTTPMMCARLLRPRARTRSTGRLYRASERAFDCRAARLRASRSAGRCAHGRIMLLLLAATIGLNVYLYVIVPKGFFPQQDTGRLIGSIQADQSISFQAMRQKLADFVADRAPGPGGGERGRLHRRRPAQLGHSCSSSLKPLARAQALAPTR